MSFEDGAGRTWVELMKEEIPEGAPSVEPAVEGEVQWVIT